MPGVSTQIIDLLDRGWHYSTLLFGELQIRTGHLLVAALKSRELRTRHQGWRPNILAELDPEEIIAHHRDLWQGSDEGNLRSMDGASVSDLQAGGEPGKGARARPRWTAIPPT